MAWTELPGALSGGVAKLLVAIEFVAAAGRTMPIRKKSPFKGAFSKGSGSAGTTKLGRLHPRDARTARALTPSVNQRRPTREMNEWDLDLGAPSPPSLRQ